MIAVVLRLLKELLIVLGNICSLIVNIHLYQSRFFFAHFSFRVFSEFHSSISVSLLHIAGPRRQTSWWKRFHIHYHLWKSSHFVWCRCAFTDYLSFFSELAEYQCVVVLVSLNGFISQCGHFFSFICPSGEGRVDEFPSCEHKKKLILSSIFFPVQFPNSLDFEEGRQEKEKKEEKEGATDGGNEERERGDGREVAGRIGGETEGETRVKGRRMRTEWTNEKNRKRHEGKAMKTRGRRGDGWSRSRGERKMKPQWKEKKGRRRRGKGEERQPTPTRQRERQWWKEAAEGARESEQGRLKRGMKERQERREGGRDLKNQWKEEKKQNRRRYKDRKRRARKKEKKSTSNG